MNRTHFKQRAWPDYLDASVPIDYIYSIECGVQAMIPNNHWNAPLNILKKVSTGKIYWTWSVAWRIGIGIGLADSERCLHTTAFTHLIQCRRWCKFVGQNQGCLRINNMLLRMMKQQGLEFRELFQNSIDGMASARAHDGKWQWTYCSRYIGKQTMFETIQSYAYASKSRIKACNNHCISCSFQSLLHW